ncbi:MAG TPA: hypothetical protein VFT22_07235 [Kofleriaceae bacterium]|nr:hypothetical protein [Kofleriaceae bacterium]
MTRQTNIPGTEPPDRDPEIDEAIATKYERLVALKAAREAVMVSDAKLLELVEGKGLQHYPFLESGTGRRKVLARGIIALASSFAALWRHVRPARREVPRATARRRSS